MKVYFVSLGCPKNLTDTEVLMGKLASEGNEITTNPAEADTIIVNTCAFLKTARDEALSIIKEMAQWKKKGKCKELYVAGCLPELIKSGNRDVQSQVSMPKEVDGVIDSLGLFEFSIPKIKATSPWTAYVKIAEGCNHHCSYCLIPTIRGNYQIRQVADIIKEVQELAGRGVKEIIYIAEDTTAHLDLPEILKQTTKIGGICWIRLMYAHPAHLSDKVIKVMAKEPKIVKYLDLPIQHASDKILRLMNRRYTRQDLDNLIRKIRRQIPKIALRTTVIVGFPGEGAAEFAELLRFLREARFTKLGCFAYQKEAGTPAGKMGRQVPEKIKNRRAKKIMLAQAGISRELNSQLIGQVIKVIIEGEKKGHAFGRATFDAPEIDGHVYIKSNKSLTPGRIVRCRVTKAGTYDLFGAAA